MCLYSDFFCRHSFGKYVVQGINYLWRWRILTREAITWHEAASERAKQNWPSPFPKTPPHCKNASHSCVVGCKVRGGPIDGDSTNSSGNDNNVFACCAGHSWYNTWSHSILNTQYSVNKQTNNIWNLTLSGNRNYQLLRAAHKMCFLGEEKYI